MKVTKAYVLFGQTPPSPVLFHTLLLDPSPLLAAYVLHGWPLSEKVMKECDNVEN